MRSIPAGNASSANAVTPLHVAAGAAYTSTARVLLDAGAAVSLRSAPFVEPPLPASLRPDDAALATHADYQVAAWLNLEGAPDQVLVAGKDAKGRDQYAARRGNGELGPRLLAVTDDAKRWLSVFTSAAAVDAFRRATPIGWPTDGVGPRARGDGERRCEDLRGR